MNKQALILDSTQIDAYLTCPQLWFYGHKERLTPAMGYPTGDAMSMGTLGHKFLELYYKAMAEGLGQQAGIDRAQDFNPDEESCLYCNKPKVYHPRESCIDFESKPFPLDKPSRAAVLQRFREYTYTYSQRDIEPISPALVEVGFSHLLFEDADKQYILEGRMDLIGSLAGTRLWTDHKFQLRSRNLYKKSIQFRNYGLVAYETMGLTMGLVNYIRLTKGITKDTFSRDIITFNAPELAMWKQTLIDIYDTIYSEQMNGTYPKNWSACSGKFGYPCDFTPLCEESNEGIIKAKHDNLYTIREEWKPW